jgi:putative protease
MNVNVKTSSGKNREAKSPGSPPFPELLAPAGSVEAYFAAVKAGADAVYLGLQKFSARERAENFTLEELCRVLPHARQRGVRVYLAMNTVLTEADLPEAIALLHQAAPLLPDAVIVQDLGLLRIVREFFPGLSLHVSTQAGCASAAAAGEFARLGAQRVILERHLRLEEVRQIVARARVGVEIFVHGAMCYSYSGKCFFSSYLGGKSGNRGACVQPCRRLYGHEGGEEAIFSTRDLSLIDLLPELVPLGFAGFKIEGRMRSAEYVAGVVSAYRTALDLIRSGKPAEGVAEGRKILSDVIGREDTRGLTGGASPGDVVAGGSTGNVGELLGAIREIRDGWAFLRGEPYVSRGDRLRIQFQSDGSGKGFTALSMRADSQGFYVTVPFPVSPGDLLFRVGGGGRAEITRQAKKEMESIRPEGVRFRVVVGDAVVAVEAAYGKVKRSFSFRVSGGKDPAGVHLPADAEGRLAAACRCDLPIGEIRVEGRGAAVSWPDVEALFVKAARKFDKDFYLSGKELRLSILPRLRVAGNRQEKLPAVFFAGCRADQLSSLPGGEEIVPVVEFTRGIARDPSPAGRGPFRNRSYLRLPAPFLEADAAFLRRTVKEAVLKGHRRWLVSDVGHLALFAGFDLRREVTLISDHYLYGFNMGALSVLSRLGASRMVLPIEAPLSALRAVGKYLHGLGIAVAYASIPLMVSRLVPAGGIREGEVVSPKAERFTVEVDDRGSTLRPVQPFSASGALHEIRSAGIQDFYVDVRDASPQEIGTIFTALREDREIPGTSTFNLFRGNF